MLIELTVRGTLASILVLLLDRALDQHQRPHWRKLWWLIVSLAWILPCHLQRSSIPSLPIPLPLHFGAASIDGRDASGTSPIQLRAWLSWKALLLDVWLGGAVLSFCVVSVRTLLTGRRWSRVRLCTNPELLDLLEDCKAVAGVRAPVGLVLSPDLSSPALLGWLRPRILLPETLASSLSRDELRGVLFHELAHFRSADIPMQWLFCFGRSLHWFNPVAHLATRRWLYFRELTADAMALAWMPEANRDAYGHALIAAVREANPLPIPQGALALGESFQQLKLRITMIARPQNRARLVWLASIVSLALFAIVLLPRTLSADTSSTEVSAKSLARAGGDSWLDLMDNGKFAESWNAASSGFKGAITSDKWVEAASHSRTPCGKLVSRNFESAAYQKDPVSGAKTIVGEFVIEQFDSSFENLKHARETISLMKDPDGQWRVAGYFIKPN